MNDPSALSLRLFVAIDPPAPVRAALEALPRPMRGVTWTPTHQYHLTLRFIGEVEAEKGEAIERALAAIRVEPFILPVEGAGTFPPKRPPRVIWVGIGNGHPRLFQLRQRIDDALLSVCGSALDVKTFHPHLTLGRCGPQSSPKEIERFVRELADFEAPPFRVSAFTLYASELRATGAGHTPRLRVELSAP